MSQTLIDFVAALPDASFKNLSDAVRIREQSAERQSVKPVPNAKEGAVARCGKKINAIKDIRSRLSLGLKEAKDAIEGIDFTPVHGSEVLAQLRTAVEWNSMSLSQALKVAEQHLERLGQNRKGSGWVLILRDVAYLLGVERKNEAWATIDREVNDYLTNVVGWPAIA